jgi:hypothetical protein
MMAKQIDFRNGVKTKTMGTKVPMMMSRRRCQSRVRGVERRGEVVVAAVEEEEAKVEENGDQNN